ncbi:AraC family transcriptional regulator [Dyadobacter chenwenxiniae]|uniref:AraC family transcriptional regulator n=1 Tax=Dyadobacter chenwenxiniae TaxID=2906456 RepID=A0A9X1PQK7_9BACT|nr:helix-turn-helix domain-containing protein [Dyadobacter chenwenxiniae]MCF0065116.1 AraC family transcriptional regulator [Dyadobacter chenwenxiniae]UON84612.1 AraC family transcriptional regulator [Dyadobacter chenwenxiniae]
MKRQGTVEDFYAEKGIISDENSHFNVFQNGDYCRAPHVYNRRDFYKISLILSKSKLSWHHFETEIDRPALVFYNPLTPFSWEPLAAEQLGYFCLFKKEFVQKKERSESLLNTALLETGSNPVFFLTDAQVTYISGIFQNMLSEIQSDYIYKYNLLKSHLDLIIHEALKMKPDSGGLKNKNASERITFLFLELLERQFPIDDPQRSLKLKTASDYADALAIHVNHLNHAVMEVTGKPTSVHISDRVMGEAKALLKHTDWPISEIAYSLGFEYANYFNNSFKKKTGQTPGTIRKSII